MMRIDDDLLMAFADGELDEVSRARVERAVAEDPELRARLEVQQRLRGRLAAHYGPALEEEVPKRLRAMLETNVVRLEPVRPAPPLWQIVTALAATIVLGFFIGERLNAPARSASRTARWSRGANSPRRWRASSPPSRPTRRPGSASPSPTPTGGRAERSRARRRRALSAGAIRAGSC